MKAMSDTKTEPSPAGIMQGTQLSHDMCISLKISCENIDL